MNKEHAKTRDGPPKTMLTEAVVVPAADGYAVVRLRLFASPEYGTDTVGSEIIEEIPIIAWKIRQGCRPDEIMLWNPDLEGTDLLNCEVRGVRLPDGRVDAFFRRFADVPTWRAYWVECWTERRDEQAFDNPAYADADGNL